jgi:diguanylate cyclase (GGDEF)-like protein
VPIKKSLLIGFLIDEISSIYATEIIRGIKQEAKIQGHKIILFPGCNLNHPDNFEFQANVIYSYISKCHLDALIMASGTFRNYITDEDFEKFYRPYKSIPLVSLNVPLDGIHSIIIDNKTGITDAVSHLVEYHRCRQIAFIKGPDENPEARDRLNAYINAMKNEQLEIDERLIVNGTFTTSSGFEAAEKLCSANVPFSSIIAANDDMAIGAMDYFKSINKRIPQEISVIGFDDSELSKYYEPPVSTVTQNLIEQGIVAVGTAVDLCENVVVPFVKTIPTRLIIRNTCGCNAASKTLSILTNKSNYDSFDEDEFFLYNTAYKPYYQIIDNCIKKELEQGKIEKNIYSSFHTILYECNEFGLDFEIWKEVLLLLAYKWKLKTYGTTNEMFIEKIAGGLQAVLLDTVRVIETRKISEYRKTAFAFRTAYSRLVSMSDIESLSAILIKNLPELEINTCFIAYYAKEIHNDRNTAWDIPRYAEIIAAIEKGEPIDLSTVDKTYSPFVSFVPEWFLEQNDSLVLIAKALYVNETQIGVALIEHGKHLGIYYETILLQISNMIKDAMLYSEKKKVDKLLTEKNLINIDTEYICDGKKVDPVTELFNRRTFVQIADQCLKQIEKDPSKVSLILITIDNFHDITSSYGIEFQIMLLQKTAEIIKKCFSSSIINARICDNEFAVLFTDLDQFTLSALKIQLLDNIIKLNNELNKPFTLTLNVAIVNVGNDDVPDISISKLISRADILVSDLIKSQKSSKFLRILI